MCLFALFLGVPVAPPPEQEIIRSKKQNRSKSQDPRKGRIFGSGAGWFNPGQVWREADQETRGLGSGGSGSGSKFKESGHWLLRERESNLVSMPPNIDTLRDSGIGLSQEESAAAASGGGSNHHLTRNEPKRSSFGMALKDKFNKNPNMYFPGPIDNHSGNGSSKSSKKSRSGSTGSPTKTNTTTDDLSDTDTLIHNMSDGSYEKESLNDHDSFGSAKGSRSSGNSSLSPHNR